MKRPETGFWWKVPKSRSGSAGKAVTMWNPSTGKYQDSFKTGEDGTIRLPNTLAYGRYTVEETKAPKGYQKAGFGSI